MTTMHVCTVVPVVFCPFPETGEFACIGVIMCCPAIGWYGYKLIKANERPFKRAAKFFDQIDDSIIRTAIRCAKQDIEYTIDMATEELDPVVRNAAFQNLIRPREGFIRYGNAKAIMVEDYRAALEEQFKSIVHRNFIDREGYYENKMRERVQDYLTSRKISFHSKKRYEFENGYFSFNIPFVLGEKDSAKLIKPLNFVTKSNNETMEHWFKWRTRFDYLHSVGFDKERILVPVRLPEPGHASYDAAYRVFDLLQKHTMTVNEDDKKQEEASVVNFATSGASV
ncbi:MAG: DUF3037 domain-containing protein [Kiritimatiellae bacterium]|nr:DUF3037 domain-containing protein [Kiritimatiellia bacterium]